MLLKETSYLFLMFRKSGLLSNEHLRSSKSSEPSAVKLPDASLLFNSTPVSSDLVSGSDHSLRVAAAIAERESRKREANILASALPRSKVPKGNFPHQKSIPDTVAGLLVPPQLRGRWAVIWLIFSSIILKKSISVFSLVWIYLSNASLE